MSRLPRVTPIASRPLLVTSDARLTEAVLAVASEAQVELTGANDLGAAVTQWSRAPLVIVDADLVGNGTSIAARPGIVVVTRPIEDVDRWRTLAEVGAEHIVELPQGAPWLYERLGRSLESDPVTDLVVVI